MQSENITTTEASDTTAPTAPQLISPADDGYEFEYTLVNFEWDDVNDESLPITYQIWIDNNADFSSPEFVETSLQESHYSTVLLDGEYYWKVSSCRWSW